ncbi:MAG: archaeosortase/exosortase family protein [Erythrobacter sp.]|nr:archaeosortase/exosortase family protein [Erythrobacter sp.]
MFAVVLVVAALNAASHRIIASLANGWFDAALSLFNLSAIVWFALFAIVRIGLEDDDRPASRADYTIAGLILLACLLPTRIPALAGLLAGAGYLLATSAPGSVPRRLATVALALGGPLFLGPVALNLFGSELLPLDAWIGGTLSGHPVVGNVIQTPLGQPDLMIMPGCSAFNNLTIVLLLALTLAQLLQVRFGRRMVTAVGSACLAMILLNGSRLASMAIWPEHFDWLHTGGGAVLFGYAALLVMAPIVGFAVLRSARDAA